MLQLVYISLKTLQNLTFLAREAFVDQATNIAPVHEELELRTPAHHQEDTYGCDHVSIDIVRKTEAEPRTSHTLLTELYNTTRSDPRSAGDICATNPSFASKPTSTAQPMPITNFQSPSSYKDPAYLLAVPNPLTHLSLPRTPPARPAQVGASPDLAIHRRAVRNATSPSFRHRYTAARWRRSLMWSIWRYVSRRSKRCGCETAHVRAAVIAGENARPYESVVNADAQVINDTIAALLKSTRRKQWTVAKERALHAPGDDGGL